VTVYETECIGNDESAFRMGSTTDTEDVTTSCLTFIVLSPPATFIHLCYLNTECLHTVRIESDVQEWNQHPSPEDSHSKLLGFPLLDNDDDETGFLCTQGECGHLTHFFSGNLHAIDFRCPIGTPLLAVGNGIVVGSSTSNALTGIAVTNLFRWNSILLQIDTTDDDPLFVEYVHIQSSIVKIGQRVQLGDVIGYSGSVGFSPEPHLHFAAYRSAKPDAATVRVSFLAAHNRETTTATDNNNDDDDDDCSSSKQLQQQPSFLPKAGYFYSREGLVVATTTTGSSSSQ